MKTLNRELGSLDRVHICIDHSYICMSEYISKRTLEIYIASWEINFHDFFF